MTCFLQKSNKTDKHNLFGAKKRPLITFGIAVGQTLDIFNSTFWVSPYLIFVTGTTGGACVKKIARCKFLQI